MAHLSGITIEEILKPYKAQVGDSFEAYLNHAQRVASIALELLDGQSEHQNELTIAAAFHDLGIWTHQTMDYLGPSSAEALRFIDAQHLVVDKRLIQDLISNHHRVSRVKEPLVEAFRKADLIDLSAGIINYGMSRSRIRRINRTSPRRGFTRIIFKKVLKYAINHPARPFPMMKK